jgi:enoyl-CoA hydratase/carnithine racemase
MTTNHRPRINPKSPEEPMLEELEDVRYEVDRGLAWITINRPERYNAFRGRTVDELIKCFKTAWGDRSVGVVALTGAGDKAFCTGGDQKQKRETGDYGPTEHGFFQDEYLHRVIRDIPKPVIAAVNGFAMGGGFMLVERTDLRVAARTAVFEVSEAKRWLLGGYYHGHIANLPYPVAMEMALGFRFTAERFHQIGFINRLVEPEQVMPEAMGMAEHLLTLPPASRVNTVYMMRQMRPDPAPDMKALADELHDHGDKNDLIESRAAFAEKRKPNFKGWKDPQDRYRMPQRKAVKA